MIDINSNYNIWYYYVNDTLIKKKKPVSPGEYIHTNSLEGCFRVYDVKINHFTVLKDRKLINLPWNQFRCKHGGGTSLQSNVKRLVRNIDYLKQEVLNLIK